jgi:hypothetical protein
VDHSGKFAEQKWRLSAYNNAGWTAYAVGLCV